MCVNSGSEVYMRRNMMKIFEKKKRRGSVSRSEGRASQDGERREDL